MYKDDKVLCTVDDILPVITVDEAVTSVSASDMNWLMKMSCSWEDSKTLQHDLGDAASSSHSLQFRGKLIEAAAQMQAALGVKDIGRLHCRPITDGQGSVLLVTVHYVADTKSVQVSHSSLRLIALNSHLIVCS